MNISNELLEFRYYIKSVNNRMGGMAYLDLTDIGYSLVSGQSLYSVRYRNTIATNQYLKYDVKVLDVTGDGVRFFDYWDKEFFYPWEKNIVNCYDKTELGILCFEPCAILNQKMNIKDLILNKTDELQRIWYWHGAEAGYSKHEKNLSNFFLLGQQKITGV